MPTVGVGGDAVWPVLSGTLGCSHYPAENAAAAETTGAFTCPELLSPSRIQSSSFYFPPGRSGQILRAWSEALRENLSAGLSDGLDKADHLRNKRAADRDRFWPNHAQANIDHLRQLHRPDFAFWRVDGRYASTVVRHPDR